MKNKKVIIGLCLLLGLVVLVFTTKETKTGYSVYTEIDLTQQEVDLGKIKKDSFVRNKLPIENIGKELLLISSIQKSNEAILIDETAQFFKKDKPVHIEFLFQPQKVGRVNEHIIVKGNFPEKEVLVKIVGVVIN